MEKSRLELFWYLGVTIIGHRFMLNSKQVSPFELFLLFFILRSKIFFKFNVLSGRDSAPSSALYIYRYSGILSGVLCFSFLSVLSNIFRHIYTVLYVLKFSV